MNKTILRFVSDPLTRSVFGEALEHAGYVVTSQAILDRHWIC
jgi:hypothetical protein